MITKYKKQNGQSAYKISLYLGINQKTGKIDRFVKQGIKTEKEAKLIVARKKSEYERKGELFKERTMKFVDVYNLWIIQYEKTVKPNSFAITERIIGKHILPVFGDYYIDQITVTDCQDALNHWYATYTKANNLVSIVRRIFEFGMMNGFVEDNPMIKTIRPKNTHKVDYEAPFYEKEQLLQFLDIVKSECSLQVQLMFRLLAFAGLRKAELLGLKWPDIQSRQLSVNQVLVKDKNHEYLLQSPKTESSKRVISIDAETDKLLKRWRMEQRKLLLKFGHNSLSNDQLVFCKVDNSPTNLSYPNKKLNKIIKKHGLPFITIHGFRHTHCSLLFEAGVELKEVQNRLGHTSIQTTVNIYQHISQSRKDKVAEKFADFIAQ